MKKFSIVLLVFLLLAALPSCSGFSLPSFSHSSSTPERTYIAIVSKGFQHQFWQTVLAGSTAAAKELDVDITFEGPASESDLAEQIVMIKAALGNHPDALCLAAIDVDGITKELEEVKAAGVPVVGFDSGVPDAPAGIIVSTASTNNYAAGALAAEKMFASPPVKMRLGMASSASPVCVGVLSQDTTSSSIQGRTKGFLDKFKELSESIHPGAVEITGHPEYTRPCAELPAVYLNVTIPSTPEYTDAQNAARRLLKDTPQLIGLFCSNEGTVTGLLAATNEGEDLDRKTGAYRDLIVIGFDAGAPQKSAVRKQQFYGSITQDPYQIGYLAVQLAYKAAKGESVDAVADTGCKFYTHENIDSPDISQLVYD